MSLRKKINLRLLYATLLQVEYILSLITGVLLGSGKWVLFGVFLALCLALGFVTTWLYWKLIEGVTDEKRDAQDAKRQDDEELRDEESP